MRGAHVCYLPMGGDMEGWSCQDPRTVSRFLLPTMSPPHWGLMTTILDALIAYFLYSSSAVVVYAHGCLHETCYG